MNMHSHDDDGGLFLPYFQLHNVFCVFVVILNPEQNHKVVKPFIRSGMPFTFVGFYYNERAHKMQIQFFIIFYILPFRLVR